MIKLSLIVLLLVVLVGCGGGKEKGSASDLTDKGDIDTLSPAIVNISNYDSGKVAEYKMSVYNGSYDEKEFVLSCRPADNPRKGYVPAPSDISNWVTISDDTPLILGRGTQDVLVKLEVPKGVKLDGKWEFWISMAERYPKTMIRTELNARWLVN